MKILNKTLIKKEFRLQRAIFFIGLVYYFLILVYLGSQELARSIDYIADEGFMNYNADSFSFEILLGSFMPLMIVFAVYLGLSFAREKQRKTMEEMARMPFSRKEIYFSKVIVSLLVLTLPLIINIGLFLIIASRISGYQLLLSSSTLFYACFITLLTSYFVYFFYVMFSMLFGSVWGSFIVASIFFTFPISLLMLIYINLDISGFSVFSKNAFEKIMEVFVYFTPGYYASLDLNIKLIEVILMIILIAVFMMMGYHMFMVYKMEKNSEFLTFRWTEYVFRIGVFICAVLAGRVMFHEILASVATPIINQTIGMIVGGVLGYLIPKKMIEKSRVR